MGLIFSTVSISFLAQTTAPDALLTLATGLLLVVAVGLLVAEFIGPTHGTAAAGGVVVLVAALLIRAREGDALHVPLLAVFGLAAVVFAAFCAMEIWLLSKRRSVSGVAGLLDALGTVREPLDPVGAVFVGGERWRATTPDRAELPAGVTVRVLAVRGLTLIVAAAPATETTLPPSPLSPLSPSTPFVPSSSRERNLA